MMMMMMMIGSEFDFHWMYPDFCPYAELKVA